MSEESAVLKTGQTLAYFQVEGNTEDDNIGNM